MSPESNVLNVSTYAKQLNKGQTSMLLDTKHGEKSDSEKW